MTTTSRAGARPYSVTDVVINVVLLAVFVLAFVTTQGYPDRAALFPEIVTAGGAVLAALRLVFLARSVLAGRSGGGALTTVSAAEHAPGSARDETDGVDEHEVEYVFGHAGRRTWLVTLEWIAAFFVLLWLLGLSVVAPVFSVIYLRFVARLGWLATALYALVAWGVLYFGFSRALELALPEGVLW